MSTTVIPAQENQEGYLADFFMREKELPGGERIRKIRRAALERFAFLGFPTTKNEDWKYTNLAPFLKTPYERGGGAGAWSGEPGRGTLVFFNGHYVAELSSPPRGVKAGSLRESLEEERIARYADFERNALVALNTALFEDGAFVEIAPGTLLEEPVEIVFVCGPGDRRVVSYPRNLIVAGRDSQAMIVETYISPEEGACFTNAVTELVAGDGAVVEHYKLQMEGAENLHYGLLRVEQGASSNFASHNIALGSGLARNEILVVLAGEGAECTLNGLYAASGGQHIDNYTTLDHARPHCTSHELYKGILDGKAQGVFHGRIIVRPDAQKTDAIQRNKNLLLSKDAVINTKPQLEIYADDVRCTHGATVGQVDEEAVFYLRSRGVPLEEARNLLTYAFTADIIGRLKVESIRSRVGEALSRRLSAGRSAGQGYEHAR